MLTDEALGVFDLPKKKDVRARAACACVHALALEGACESALVEGACLACVRVRVCACA